MTPPSRRRFMASLPFMLAAPRLLAQKPVSLRSFNHVSLTVSNLQRSIDFYQGLFGYPVQSRQGTETAALRIGAGPQHLGLSTNPSSGVLTPRIDHMCLGIEDFDLDRLLKHLAGHGIRQSEQRGAAQVNVRMRSAAFGGGATGTPEVYLGDPDGVLIQLQDANYCAGSGLLGTVCTTPVPSSKKGLIQTRAYSHCTIHSVEPERSNAFYRRLFGMGIRSYQGPIATLAIGTGIEFLVNSIPSNAAQSTPGSINHFCLTADGFDVNRLIKVLESFGIKARENEAGPVPPMRHYVKARREDQGGAREGTPELYFTDPDGILVQLQDVSYCGGSGVLGNVCPPG